MTGLCNGYYLLFYPVLVGMWVLWFTRNEAWWRRAGSVTLAGIVAVAVLAPVLLTYQQVHDEMGFARGVGEIRGFSADVSGLLSGPPASVFWSFPDGVYRPEGQLFPGLLVMLLVGAGLLQVRWRSAGPEPRALRTLRYLVGAASVAFALALVARLLFGPWELAVGGLSVSVERPANVMAQGMLLWFFSAVLSPAGAWAYRRHSAFGFYALAAFFLFVLALGPEPKAFGHDFMAHSVYKALLYLPGYDGLRVPARFWMLVTICVSILAGLSFSRVAPVSWGTARRWGLAILLAGGVLADGWVVWPTAAAPASVSLLDRVQGPVVELPLGRGFQDIAAMFRTISHRQPLVNGFSGYSPPHYQALQHGLRRRNPEVLEALVDLGVRFVRVDRERDANGRSERFVSGYAGTRLVAETEAEAVYALPFWRRHRPKRDYGAPLEIAELRASARSERIGDAMDGALDTRWEAGAQTVGQTVTVRLAETSPVGAVVLNLGPYRADFPRRLMIETSKDGERWDEAWAGSTETTAMRGAMTHPSALPLTFPLGGRVARYLRLRLTEDHPVYYWVDRRAVGVRGLSLDVGFAPKPPAVVPRGPRMPHSTPAGRAVRGLSQVWALGSCRSRKPEARSPKSLYWCRRGSRRGHSMTRGPILVAVVVMVWLSVVAGPTLVGQSDDVVATLVARLDLEQYKRTILGLTAFGDRRQGTTRNREAVDWIEAQLQAVGCPTERLDYVYDPPPRGPRARRRSNAPLNPTEGTPTGGRIGRNGTGPGGASIFGYRRRTGVERDPMAQPDARLRALNSEEPVNGPRQQVYCTKVGSTRPEEMYIIGAHMDGHGMGEAANDDGSGTALVIELARILNAPDVETERSIRFALWNNEETGLNGSRAYVEQRRELQGVEDPPGSGRYPEPVWLGMIQHDMMLFDHGAPRADGTVSRDQRPEADVNIEYQSEAALAAEARDLAFFFKASNDAYATDYPASVGPHMTNTDSTPFMDHVPSISLRENERGMHIGAGWDPHWHQPTDVFSTFSDDDFRLGLNAAQTTLAAVAQLAGARLAR